MSAGLKAVAWDIDGTLIDSEPAHHRALVDVCAGYGLDLSDLTEDMFLGVHIHDVWRALQPRLPTGLCEAEWTAAVEAGFARHAASLAAQPGAVETVRALASLGVPQCAVSNSGRLVVDANLAALGIADLLAFSLALDDVGAGKPDPEPYRTACDRMGAAPEQTLAVEDSTTGAASARAAGLVVMGYGANLAGSAPIDLRTRDLRDVLALLAPS